MTRLSPTAVALPALLFATSGCADLTKVAAPDVVTVTAFESPAGAAALRGGAIVAFANGLASQALVSGLIADELTDRGGGYQLEDSRRPLQQSAYPYGGLSLARDHALEAIPNLEQYDPSPAWHIGELFAYAGLVEVYLAEGMCSGVPIANVTRAGAQPGQQLADTAMLHMAEAHFDSALAHVGTSDSVQSLAHVGLGRARLDLGQFAAAAAAVDSVPEGFAYEPPYDGVNQINWIYQAIVTNVGVSVSDREGQNGLPFISAVDVRVPTAFVATVANGDSVFTFVTYASTATPISAATGMEARLIVAEAQLPAHGGTGSAWLDTLNALRATIGLSPLADPGTDPARLDLLMQERAFWLFGTGHRQGDLRRLIRQYGRGAESAFPTGTYDRGPGAYGTDVNFEPYGESPNANYRRCTVRDS